jgi:DNA repair protein RecN (Recombination protein N)
MLSHLSIRDVVLVERLELEFENGFSVLTGETGAGKSILLDALGLTTGARAEARLVRNGAERANVSAVFDLREDHAVRYQLSEQGIETAGEPVILRRVLNADGRSRAFANDQAISIGLLKDVGAQLVEVHGQFDNQRLMRPESHRMILDSFSGESDLIDGVRGAYAGWRDVMARRATAIADAANTQRDEDFLRFAVQEMAELAPQPGEEVELSNKRKMMMHSEKLVQALADAQNQLGGENTIDQGLQRTLRALEQVRTYADDKFDDVIARFEAAHNEVLEGMGQLDRLSSQIMLEPEELEAAEERLFALRAVARKHQVRVDDLSDLKDEFERRLGSVEDSAQRLAVLEHEERKARDAFVVAAERIREVRTNAGTALDQAVDLELADLKLKHARFHTYLAPLNEADWNEYGMDRVAFLVATNPDSAPGPINKIASGGELARFMLALKAVLATADPVPTLVFDEADAGLGGAVAAAVGDRLARLAAGSQVLVVTHSPQVAAKGDHHWRVSKSEIATVDQANETVWTTVEPLDSASRQDEIARMLAGAHVTDEARAAADRLLAGGDS